MYNSVLVICCKCYATLYGFRRHLRSKYSNIIIYVGVFFVNGDQWVCLFQILAFRANAIVSLCYVHCGLTAKLYERLSSNCLSCVTFSCWLSVYSMYNMNVCPWSSNCTLILYLSAVFASLLYLYLTYTRLYRPSCYIIIILKKTACGLLSVVYANALKQQKLNLIHYKHEIYALLAACVAWPCYLDIWHIYPKRESLDLVLNVSCNICLFWSSYAFALLKYAAVKRTFIGPVKSLLHHESSR